jgi:hypothetical protein
MRFLGGLVIVVSVAHSIAVLFDLFPHDYTSGGLRGSTVGLYELARTGLIGKLPLLALGVLGAALGVRLVAGSRGSMPTRSGDHSDKSNR